MIPGLNDSEDHLNGVKKLISKNPGLKSVELMPYHNLGKGKAERIGLKWSLNHIPLADELIKGKWINYFRDVNINITFNN